MSYIFTSESVCAGYPDKVADQISDAIVDAYLAHDPHARVAAEVMVGSLLVVISGKVCSTAKVDIEPLVRQVIRDIGYTDPDLYFDADHCKVEIHLHEQAADIRRGVDRDDPDEQGASDQGMMFGYATNETQDYMPLPIFLAHRISASIDHIRRDGKYMTYLRPDGKCQVSIEYDDNGKPQRIDTIVVSVQHTAFADDETMHDKIRDDIMNIVLQDVRWGIYDLRIRLLFKEDFKLLVNPTGRFVIGGPHGDTGMTGRKLQVDSYGGRCPHGGGSYTSKDPSKVDRSAAYMARYIAKNMVAAGIADEMLIQISYAIGVARPVSIFVNTYGTCRVNKTDEELAHAIDQLFDLRPRGIEDKLELRKPIYRETAINGHFGHESWLVMKEGFADDDTRFFPWEALDDVDKIKAFFGIDEKEKQAQREYYESHPVPTTDNPIVGSTNFRQIFDNQEINMKNICSVQIK